MFGHANPNKALEREERKEKQELMELMRKMKRPLPRIPPDFDRLYRGRITALEEWEPRRKRRRKQEEETSFFTSENSEEKDVTFNDNSNADEPATGSCNSDQEQAGPSKG